MNNNKLYSAIVILFVALVIASSVFLISVDGNSGVKSIASILKNGSFEKYSDAFKGNRAKIEQNKGDEPIEGNDEDEEKGSAQTGMSGGVLIEQSTRRVLLDEGMNVRCYPASTTKVLTALVVLEHLPLDKIVTVPKIAEGVEGSSIYLKEGQKISVEDLLLGLMLRSGNDAAVTLAVETAGSLEEFARLMNETAMSLGAVNSNFVNPHGLHDENHYTTAYDLALIAAKAYENENFVKIVSSERAKIVVDGEPRYIANKNKLLKFYAGSNGVKTGYTKKSGRCLVGGAKRGGMQLISVVLNCPDMWNDTIRMLNFGFDEFEMVPIEKALLNANNGGEKVVFKGGYPIFENWKEVRYPLKKDGSEYIEFAS